MWLWCCGEMILLSAVILINLYACGERINFVSAGIAAVSSTGAYLLAFSLKSAAVFIMLIVGEAFYIALQIINKKPNIPISVSLLAGANALIVPFVWNSDGEYRKYFIIAPAILFFAALSVLYETGGTTADVPENRSFPILLSVLFPVLILAFSLTVCFTVKDFTALTGILWFVLLLGIYCLLLLVFSLFSERENIKKLLAETEKWQRESRDYLSLIRSQRHDLNLHLHAISGLVNSGKYAECDEYVNRLVKEAGDINDIMPVSDAVVGSMLYNMREQARAKGSEIYYNIKYDLDSILCSGFECNKIIGNLLQNAIDALSSDEDRAYGIHTDIFKRSGCTVISVENRFTGSPEKITRAFETGYSTKDGHEGIGLPMVRKTVERYGGRIYPEFGADTIRFIARIPNRFTGIANGEDDEN